MSVYRSRPKVHRCTWVDFQFWSRLRLHAQRWWRRLSITLSQMNRCAARGGIAEKQRIVNGNLWELASSVTSRFPSRFQAISGISWSPVAMLWCHAKYVSRGCFKILDAWKTLSVQGLPNCGISGHKMFRHASGTFWDVLYGRQLFELAC